LLFNIPKLLKVTALVRPLLVTLPLLVKLPLTLSVVVAGIIRCPVDVIVKLLILKVPLAGNVYVVVNGFGISICRIKSY
jgi:hypothetical protein